MEAWDDMGQAWTQVGADTAKTNENRGGMRDMGDILVKGRKRRECSSQWWPRIERESLRHDMEQGFHDDRLGQTLEDKTMGEGKKTTARDS